MTGATPNFASFVGVAGADLAPLAGSARWQACMARAASRVAAPPCIAAGSQAIAAYRGPAAGFHRDEAWMVLVDGTVENLRALAGALHPEDAGDAAILASLYARRGDALLPHLAGSFALVIARLDTGEVTLARDRFGSRPLFHGRCAEGVAFASEIKSLAPLVHPAELDPEGLRQAIHYRFVIGETLLRNVGQVLPASRVRLAPGCEPSEGRYWRLGFEPATPRAGLDAWVDRTDAALDATMRRIRRRHASVGVLLSGGVDSSLLAMKARQAGFDRCIALTARWPGENPELELAQSIARHLGIEHQVVDIDESRFERLLPWIVWRLEELPRHYNSLVLACLIEHAAPQVGTILHGHSADALFGPGEAVAIATFIRRRRIFGLVPPPLRRLLAARLPHGEGGRVRRLREYLELDEHDYLKSHYAIEYGRARAPLADLHFRPRGFSARTLDNFYEAGDPALERLQRLDTYTFNQSHFTVLDRLSAPFGVAVATPFVSHEMLDVARELPSELKVAGTLTKPLLKRLMARSFPHEWVYRRKQGFPTHTERWLTQPLSRWRQVLSEERTRARGLLSLQRRRKEDVGRFYETVWSSICLEIFCRQFLDGDGGPEFPAA